MGRIMEINQVKPLSANEKAKLEQLEGVIRDNIEGFVKVGLALAEIRDRELYRWTHKTFEQYVRDVFDMARQHAYRLMDAAEVAENLSPNGRQIPWTPKNERQVRPLINVYKSNPGQLTEILEMAVETAKNGKITAAHIDRTVKKYLGDQTTKAVRKTRKKAAAKKQVSADFKKAFDAFLDQINIAVKEGFSHTSRLEVLKHLRAIQDAIEGVA